MKGAGASDVTLLFCDKAIKICLSLSRMINTVSNTVTTENSY